MSIELPADKITDVQRFDLSVLTRPSAQKFYKRFDGIIIFVLFAFIALGIMLQYSLTAGDWDYWVDWRDRRWWPLVTPITFMIFIGGFMYPVWRAFRLPIIATAVTTLLALCSWVSRYYNFHLFADFPMSFVFPSTYIALGILMDCVLAMTRSMIMTTIVGAFLFAGLLWPVNWPLLAAYKVPVEYNGLLLSVSDLMGYEYVRTTTPEYLRIIEESTLRTFGGSVTPLTAVFAAFASILVFALATMASSAIYNYAGRYTRRIA